MGSGTCPIEAIGAGHEPERGRSSRPSGNGGLDAFGLRIVERTMTRSQRSFWLLGLLLLIAWAGTMLWAFGLRAPLGGDPAPPSAVAADGPRETWLAVFTGEGSERRRVGFVHLEERPRERHGHGGSESRMLMSTTFLLFGRETSLAVEGGLWRPSGSLADAGAPAPELDLEVRSGEARFAIAGAWRDGVLEAAVESAGESFQLELPVDPQLTLSGGLGAPLRLPPLEPGERATLPTLDPVTLRAATARVTALRREPLEIAGRTRQALALRVDAGGMSSEIWVDDAGDVLRASTPLGLTLERTTPEAALLPADSGAAGDLLQMVAIRPTGERPHRGATAMAIVLDLGGATESGAEVVDSPLAHLPTDASQSVERLADGARIVIRPLETPRATPEPEPAVLRSLLAADPLVQSDHPLLQETAASIAPETTDPTTLARALADWVHRRLDKVAVLGVPSALEVLEQGRGDCNEHTILFAALARARGLPTRIAVGLVWSEDLDGFYYHAWPEIWTGEGWLWLDPTLGQPLADATHVKLLNGGITAWPQLIPFLGRARIEVVAVEKPS